MKWFQFFKSDDEDHEFPTLPPDRISWEVRSPSRVVAVGDLHGDLTALSCILQEARLVNGSGHWNGKDSQLVLVGDLIGGHEDSRLLLNFVIRLQKEASLTRGAVHCLLGNHDILPMVGFCGKMTQEEKDLFRDYPIRGAEGSSAKSAFRGHSIYARWIRTRNTFLKIGNTIFVHGGLGPWAIKVSPERINSTVRAWIRYWQGVDAKPPKKTSWVVGIRSSKRGIENTEGPLWSRGFRPVMKDGELVSEQPNEGLHQNELEDVLKKFLVERVVVGHSPVEEILTSHPYYGKRVVMIDTRISEKKKGRLGGLEVFKDRVTLFYTERQKKLSFSKREMQKLEREAYWHDLLSGVSESLQRGWGRLKEFLRGVDD